MADTTVTEAACDLCGAKIRDGSLYCYNCGNAVPAKRDQTELEKSEKMPPKSEIAPGVEAAAEVNSRPPLRSAASLRNQRRAYNRQPVEVKWEPKGQTPKLFVFASITLAAGALVLLLIALYLR